MTSFAAVLFARITSAIGQAIALLLMARHLEPASFGQFVAVWTVGSVLLALSDMGTMTAAHRALAKDHRDDLETSKLLFGSQLLLDTSMAALLAIVFAFLAAASVLPNWAFLASFPILLDKWLNTSVTAQLSIRSVRAQVPVLAGARMVALVGVILAIHLSVDPIWAYLVSVAAGALIGLLGLRVGTEAGLPQVKHPTGLGKLICKGMPFWLATASGQIRNLDVAIVVAIAGPAMGSMYALPAKMSGPVRLFSVAMTSVAVPAAARGDREEIRILAKNMRRMGLALTSIGLVVIFFMPALVRALLGATYLDAVAPARILLVGLLFNIFGSFTSGVLQGSGHERFIGRLGVFLGILSLTAVICGTYLAGAMGAASGMALVYIVQWIYLLIYTRTKGVAI